MTGRAFLPAKKLRRARKLHALRGSGETRTLHKTQSLYSLLSWLTPLAELAQRNDLIISHISYIIYHMCIIMYDAHRNGWTITCDSST